MSSEYNFEFIYKDYQPEKYNFYRIPQVLMHDDRFNRISSEAKMLYTILLDRMTLSLKNKWFDSEGRVYVKFTVESIGDVLHCSKGKVEKCFSELDNKKGVGLIERKRKGRGKANWIYVKDFMLAIGEDGYDYFYKKGMGDFKFYRIPKVIINDEKFNNLSCTAQILYSLLLDRLSLSFMSSANNEWVDQENRVYIIFSLEEAAEILECSMSKVIRCFAQLDDKKGIGLIAKKRRGQGKKDLIYVKNFMDSRGGASSDANSTLTEVGSVEDIDDDETKVESVENFQGSTSEESDSGVDMACTAEQNVDFKYSLNDISDNDMLNSEIKICQNKNSIGANLTGQDCSNVEGNETYRIQTDSSVTDSNQSIESEEPYEELRNRIDMIDGTVKQRIFERMIKKHIAYEVVCQEYSPMKVDELVQLMVNTICSPQRYIRINGDNESAEVVKARFLKINDMHIRYVLERLNSNTTKIRNIRNYLLTALYNAPDTMENFYEAEVHYNSGAVVSENIDMNENGVHQEVESRHEVIAELESLFSRE